MNPKRHNFFCSYLDNHMFSAYLCVKNGHYCLFGLSHIFPLSANLNMWICEEERKKADEYRTREESHSLIKVLHNTICAIILHNEWNHNWFQNQWSQELTLFSFRFPQRHISWEIQCIAALLLPSKNSSSSVTWNSVFLYTYSLTYSHPLKHSHKLQDLDLEEQGGMKQEGSLSYTHTYELHCYWGRYYSNTTPIGVS